MRFAKYLLALAIGASTVLTFWAPDAQNFLNPKLARIIFWHLPAALLCTLFLMAGAVYGLMYLRKREAWHLEVKSAAATDMAWMLSLLTMATGILFSKVQWNAWWHWDPRQTSFLLVLLILAGYKVLRLSIADDEIRARSSAVYMVMSILPSLFLIFVFPRLPQVMSFHPNETIMTGGFDPTYRSIWLSMLGLFAVLTVWMFRMRVRAALLEHEVEIKNESMDDRGYSPVTGVVRPVSIHAEDRELDKAR